MEQDDILLALAEFSEDPLGFVMFAYPWGEEGTELEDYPDGPEEWQREILHDLGQGVIDTNEAIARAAEAAEKAEASPILLARSSGHGIGKSAMVSWISHWALSTFEDTRGVLTANTETQLKTKTWVELSKWHRMFIARDLFKITATGIFSADPEHSRTWRLDAVPWSEKNMEAFAGLHNQGKRIFVLFDEASSIADAIWETTEGALTDKNTQIIWVCFGNPTKSSGRFRECFPGGRFAKRWNTKEIDSRSVSFTNKKQIQSWIDDYGIDHDFVRVRVLGKFPRVDAVSFIGYELALAATRRPVPEGISSGVVLGVDCARYGDAKSVIYPRRGLDARTLQPRLYQGLSSIELTNAIFRAYHELNAVAIFIDTGYIGAAVYDNLLHMNLPAYEVAFGGGADNSNLASDRIKYLNKRAEIWGGVLNFLNRGGCIPEHIPGMDVSLPTELSVPSYTYSREDYLQLESKKDLRRRGEVSPDVSDALACTFAYSFADHLPAAGMAQAATYFEPNPHNPEAFFHENA